MLKLLKWVCLVGGVGLLGLYGGLRIHGIRGSAAALDRFEEARRELPSDFEYDQSLWAPGRIAEYHESLNHQFEPPLAMLSIPDLDLKVPVLAGTDELTLNRAVGHIPGTALPGETGNVALAGHRDGFFRGLKDVELGDVIVLQTLSERIEYVIDVLQLVEPSNVSVLDPTTSPTLTLVTCYPFYYVGKAPLRFIVRATGTPKLVETLSQSQNASLDAH